MKGEESNRDKKEVEYARKEMLEENRYYGGGKLPFDLTGPEKNIVKDSVLDTCSSLAKVISLIEELRRANNWNNYLNSFSSAASSCLASLKEFRNAPRESDKGKCAQAAKNNNDLLTKAINLVQPKYLAKSQELRNLVINSLEWWILDHSYLRNNKPKQLRQEEIREIGVGYLAPEHFQEIRNLMIKDIKETATDWKIAKSVGWLDEKTGEEWYVELVLQNIKKPHRRFNIRTFTEREWEEIKQVVKNHQCKEQEEEYLRQGRWGEPDLPPIPPKTPENSQNKNNQVQPNGGKLFSQNTLFLIVGSIVLIVIVGIWVIYRKRRKNS